MHGRVKSDTVNSSAYTDVGPYNWVFLHPENKCECGNGWYIVLCLPRTEYDDIYPNRIKLFVLFFSFFLSYLSLDKDF